MNEFYNRFKMLKIARTLLPQIGNLLFKDMHEQIT